MSILAKSPDLTKIIKKAVERIGEDHAKSRDRKEDYHGITLKNEDLAIEKALKEASNEMAEKMVLENTINVLEKFGIEEIVINTHYLSDKINSFINNKKFSAKVFIEKESYKILGTGGGILNAAKKFGNHSFFVFNSDTIWSESYFSDFKKMEKKYFNNNRKAVLLLSDKKKSFDKTMNGDFNLKKGIIDRSKGQKKYIYIGAQILNNSVFRNKKIGTFSMNLIWNFLIKKKYY